MSDETEKLKEERQRIAAVLEQVDPFSEGRDSGDEAPESFVVTGWVVICEHMDENGERWLSHFSGDATASKGLPSWTVQGMCHDVLAREGAKS